MQWHLSMLSLLLLRDGTKPLHWNNKHSKEI
jgi:hypothetical protein